MSAPRRPGPPSGPPRAIRRPPTPLGAAGRGKPATTGPARTPESSPVSAPTPESVDTAPKASASKKQRSDVPGWQERIAWLRRRKEKSRPENSGSMQPSGMDVRAGSALEAITSPDNKSAAVYQATGPLPVSSLADRRRELSKESRRRWWRKFAIGAGIAALVAGVGYIFMGSSLLALNAEQVILTGEGIDTDRAGVEEVIEGHVGTPLVLLDPTQVAAEVSQVSGVKSVTVRREWPQGVHVEIVPREAVANVATSSGYAAVDEQGITLAKMEEPREGVPLVEIPLEDPQTEPALHAVLAVLGKLPTDLLELTAVGEADHGRWVTLKLHSGTAVVWGTPEEGELKAAVLNTLLQIEANEYDVSSPLAPVTR